MLLTKNTMEMNKYWQEISTDVDNTCDGRGVGFWNTSFLATRLSLPSQALPGRQTCLLALLVSAVTCLSVHTHANTQFT